MMTQVWMRINSLPHWKWENPAAENIPASENNVSEAKNDCATEIKDPEYDSTYKSPHLGM